MTTLFDSSPSGETAINDISLSRAQVVRGNDPLQQSGIHYFTKGSSGVRFLYQDGEKLFWQPNDDIPKDVVARW